jgi:hypothetical protein
MKKIEQIFEQRDEYHQILNKIKDNNDLKEKQI